MNIQKWLLALHTSALLAGSAIADDGGRTYLALGDAWCAGQLEGACSCDDRDLFYNDIAYTNVLFDHLESNGGFKTLLKLCCTDDDSAEFVTGDGSLCYGDGTPPFADKVPSPATSQLKAATEYLKTNPGDVGLISISLGGEDLIACNPPKIEFDEVPACVVEAIEKFADNLVAALRQIRNVDPTVPIVAMNVPNPFIAFYLGDAAQAYLAGQSEMAIGGFNSMLEGVYSRFGIPVVDAVDTFDGFDTTGNPPKNVRQVCKYTSMCEKIGKRSYALGEPPDAHPNVEGYKVLGEAHIMTVTDSLGFPRKGKKKGKKGKKDSGRRMATPGRKGA